MEKISLRKKNNHWQNQGWTRVTNFHSQFLTKSVFVFEILKVNQIRYISHHHQLISIKRWYKRLLYLLIPFPCLFPAPCRVLYYRIVAKWYIPTLNNYSYTFYIIVPSVWWYLFLSPLGHHSTTRFVHWLYLILPLPFQRANSLQFSLEIPISLMSKTPFHSIPKPSRIDFSFVSFFWLIFSFFRYDIWYDILLAYIMACQWSSLFVSSGVLIFVKSVYRTGNRLMGQQ